MAGKGQWPGGQDLSPAPPCPYPHPHPRSLSPPSELGLEKAPPSKGCAGVRSRVPAERSVRLLLGAVPPAPVRNRAAGELRLNSASGLPPRAPTPGLPRPPPLRRRRPLQRLRASHPQPRAAPALRLQPGNPSWRGRCTTPGRGRWRPRRVAAPSPQTPAPGTRSAVPSCGSGAAPTSQSPELPLPRATRMRTVDR